MANPVTTQACPICLEKFSKMKRVIITLGCSHVYCRKCLRSYVLEQLVNGSNIRCPDPDCTANLDLTGFGPLKGLVSQKLIKAAQQKNKFNGCPVPRCPGTIKDGQCDRCHIKLCSQCGEIEHVGKECNPDIKASHQQILCDSKSCPNCHVLIYKDGGCNHVHCKKCNKDFDWITMRPWDIVIQEMITLAEQNTPVLNNQQEIGDRQDIGEDTLVHPLDIVRQHNQSPRVIFQTQITWLDESITPIDGRIIRELTNGDTFHARHMHDSQQFNEERVIG